jgi:hypothetical protein
MEKAAKQGASCFALSTNVTLVKKPRKIKWAACRRINIYMCTCWKAWRDKTHTWEDNNKLEHKEIGCNIMFWIQLTQYRTNRLINMVMNLWVI